MSLAGVARSEVGRIAPVCARCSGVRAAAEGVPMAVLVDRSLVVRDGEVYRVIARCHGEETTLEVSGAASLEDAERAIRDARLFGGK